jgi:tungstate transport system ATP-binding protein
MAMAGSVPVYRLEAVRQRYGDRTVLDVDRLDVERGETLAVIGPSGSGKSTLLRLLQFLEQPASGRLVFEEQPAAGIPPLAVRRRITTVFQRPVMLDRSVRENLAFGLRLRGEQGYHGRIDRLLDALALTPLAGAHARTLSGGEVQRVAFGRALALEPDVLLLDEPTANLDPHNVRIIEQLLRAERDRGVTVVLATHQVFQARRLSHRTALLLDGRLVEIGPTARVLDSPHDPRTKAFVSGDMVY